MPGTTSVLGWATRSTHDTHTLTVSSQEKPTSLPIHSSHGSRNQFNGNPHGESRLRKGWSWQPLESWLKPQKKPNGFPRQKWGKKKKKFVPLLTPILAALPFQFTHFMLLSFRWMPTLAINLPLTCKLCRTHLVNVSALQLVPSCCKSLASLSTP